MKKITSAVLMILVLISCSGNKKRIVIEGEIDGMKNDTILAFGAENKGDALDTIYAKDGKFTYSAPLDTFTTIRLLFKNMQECVVFANKGEKIKISGDISNTDILQVNGNDLNEEMNSFKKSIADISKSTSQLKKELYTSYISGNQNKYNEQTESSVLIKANNEIKDKAEAFIREHNSSLVSSYLLDRYFVQQPNPDTKKIKELVAVLSGSAKETPFIQQLIKMMNAEKIVNIGNQAPYFYLPGNNNNYVNLANYRNRYLLINFWASWSNPSRKANATINSIYKRFGKNHFSILNISIDADKKSWTDAIKRDSLAGEHASDLNGWNSPVVQNYGVEAVPSNVLIDPQGRIMARNLEEKELITKLQELFIENKTPN